MDNPYQAPQGQILTPTGGTNPQSWKEILFSFKGRIPRRQFWGAVGIQMLLVIPILVIIAMTGNVDSQGEITAKQGSGGLIAALIVPLYILLLWVGLAVSVKRWHDRDKSGWWILINFVPFIGGIWAFIENGCLRGTEGPNRFGDDPT